MSETTNSSAKAPIAIVQGQAEFDDGLLSIECPLNQRDLRVRGKGFVARVKVDTDKFTFPIYDGNGNKLDLTNTSFVTVEIPLPSIEQALTESIQTQVINRKNVDRKTPLLTPAQKRNRRLQKQREQYAAAAIEDQFSSMDFNTMGELLQEQILNPTIKGEAAIRGRALENALAKDKVTTLSKTARATAVAAATTILALIDAAGDKDSAIDDVRKIIDKLSAEEVAALKPETETEVPVEVVTE